LISKIYYTPLLVTVPVATLPPVLLFRPFLDLHLLTVTLHNEPSSHSKKRQEETEGGSTVAPVLIITSFAVSCRCASGSSPTGVGFCCSFTYGCRCSCAHLTTLACCQCNGVLVGAGPHITFQRVADSKDGEENENLHFNDGERAQI